MSSLPACLQIWLSTSSDLHFDALRDLRALGAHITVINNCQTLDKETRVGGLSKSFTEGVLFMCAHADCWIATAAAEYGSRVRDVQDVQHPRQPGQGQQPA